MQFCKEVKESQDAATSHTALLPWSKLSCRCFITWCEQKASWRLSTSSADAHLNTNIPCLRQRELSPVYWDAHFHHGGQESLIDIPPCTPLLAGRSLCLHKSEGDDTGDLSRRSTQCPVDGMHRAHLRACISASGQAKLALLVGTPGKEEPIDGQGSTVHISSS